MLKRAISYGRRFTRPAPWQNDNLLEIGTRDIFTDDHDLAREQFRRFWRSIDRSRVTQWEEQGFVDPAFWREVGKQGLIGIETAAEVGGHGGDFLTHITTCEEQVYASVPGNFLIQSDMVLPYLAKYGTTEQQEHFIPKMIAGECIGAIAMSEPHAGSNLQGMKTFARRDGDDFVINGSKVFISNGFNADMILLCCLTDRDVKAAHGMSIFCIDTTTPGFKKGRVLKKLGMKSSDTAELFFEDMRVPASAVLSGTNGLNRGFYFLMHDLGRERLMLSVNTLANCENMFEQTRRYCHEREAFGGPLIKKQQVRHTLAEAKAHIVAMRIMVDHTIAKYASGNMDQQTASILKLTVTETCVQLITTFQQLHGGYGFMEEYPIAKTFTNVRVGPIYGGSSEIMKEIISRTI